MKAKFVPVFFQSAQDPDFVNQLANLKTLLADEAEILEPVALGDMLPDSDGIIFPQMLGDAYRKLELLRTLPQPLMVITSEFGAVSMWDWEIVSYLKIKDVKTIAPNSLEKTRQACRAFTLRRQLKRSKFLIYQDNPASVGGNQDDIFKRFYWLEPECLNAIKQRYGIEIVKKSFKNLAIEAKKHSRCRSRGSLENEGIENANSQPFQTCHFERSKGLHAGQARFGQRPRHHRSGYQLSE